MTDLIQNNVNTQTRQNNENYLPQTALGIAGGAGSGLTLSSNPCSTINSYNKTQNNSSTSTVNILKDIIRPIPPKSEENKNRGAKYYLKRALVIGIISLPIMFLEAFFIKKKIPVNIDELSKVKFLNIGKLFDENYIKNIKNDFIKKRLDIGMKHVKKLLTLGKNASYLDFAKLHLCKIIALDFALVFTIDKVIRPLQEKNKSRSSHK